MMERELGEGYSFIKKKCFVCSSLSHLIRDCDFYEKKMARKAELKKQRVFNIGNRVAKPVWNNANRVNHANHFVPRPVQLNAVRPKSNSVMPNVNTVRQNVNSIRSNINTVRPKQPVPTSNSNSFSSVRPQVNKFNQRSNFSKSHSLVRSPIVRNTAKMPYVVKGNWGSAVKTSAGEADISPKGLEAAETLTKVLTQRTKTYTRKVKTRLRRKLDVDEVNTGKGINTGFTDVNTAFEEINSGNKSIIPSPKKGQREGKAVLEEKSQSKKKKRQKKQIRGRAKCFAKIDELELSETQKNMMAQVQEAAKYYTEEDWDSVRAKLEANRDMSQKCYQLISLVMILLRRWKGLQKNKFKSTRSNTEEDVEAYMDERVDEPSSKEFQMGSIPQGSAPAKIAKRQILKTGKKGAYQIIREDHTDVVYVNFQGLLNDLTRDDLKELYRLMMLKYGDSKLKKNMKEFLGGFKDHAAHIYMPTEVKYPLPSRVCQAMLEKRLIRDRKDEGYTPEVLELRVSFELATSDAITKILTSSLEPPDAIKIDCDSVSNHWHQADRATKEERYKVVKIEAKKVAAQVKDTVFEGLYNKLDSKEGANDIIRIPKSRER
ncbi:hypothetical protein Tco_1547912 [Tanacetum coccineum]